MILRLASIITEGIKENPVCLGFSLMLGAVIYLWAGETFASKEDTTDRIEHLRTQVQEEFDVVYCELDNISQMVMAQGIQSQLSDLRRERRELNRELSQLMRLMESGDATERELFLYDDLDNDLIEVEEAIEQALSKEIEMKECRNGI